MDRTTNRRFAFLIAAAFLNAAALTTIGSIGCSTHSTDHPKTNEPKAAEAPSITVAMKAMSFDPKRLEIHVGNSMAWTNLAHTTHTATSDDDGRTFDTAQLEPGQTSNSIRFDTAGEFTYHCSVHGKAMSGTIVVVAGAQKPTAAQNPTTEQKPAR